MADNEKSDSAPTFATEKSIASLIYEVRGRQVLLDSDVARLYGYEVKAINQAANRNIERFPPEFRFQMTKEEVETFLSLNSVTIKTNSALLLQGKDSVETNRNSRSQNVTLKEGSALYLKTPSLKPKQGSNLKYLPFVYTEQGIAMLSGLLKNETAVQVSIGIMNAFVEMRQFISANQDVFANILSINRRLVEHDELFAQQGIKIDEVLSLLNTPETPAQSIFFKGQFYDAHKLVLEIISSAKENIILIDNYTNDVTLDMFTKKQSGVSLTIVTSNPSMISKQCLVGFIKQYGEVRVVANKDFHDRFIVLDHSDVFAIGASLKDLGKKCFEISKCKDTERFIKYVEQVIKRSNI